MVNDVKVSTIAKVFLVFRCSFPVTLVIGFLERKLLLGNLWT